jgi:hypothetical protein
VFPQASNVPVQGEFANLDPNADGCLDAAQYAVYGACLAALDPQSVKPFKAFQW